MVGWEDVDVLLLAQELAGQGVYLDDALDLVAKELDADRSLFIGRDQFEGVAADAEFAPGEVHVIALVLHVHELPDELAAVADVAHFELGHEVKVVLWVAKAIDAGYGGDN